jgi:hypothetical protein
MDGEKTYINISPHTKIPQNIHIDNNEKYIVPHSCHEAKMIIINFFLDRNNYLLYVTNIHNIIKPLGVKRKTIQIQKNTCILKAINSLSYIALHQCNKAILFISKNSMNNDSIYIDIDEMHKSNKYISILLYDESGTETNITTKQQYHCYQCKQYLQTKRTSL